MAFDQSTRNRLQKFVSDARKLLSEEFTQQLQNTYGLDPVTGDIASLSDLPSLSPSEQQTAKLLRDTLEHYLAANHKADPYADKALVTAALDRIVREQAFTVLNRLAALRMAEARQFVMESISKGYQSKGFQLYQRIAGSALGETGQAYQVYLFSMFDELSLDLAVLFDRYSSQGRLFPRETVLLELLDLVNHAELEMLWAEDETVGWIYQYFNSKEERKKMRDESQAPRNSRELAVRNQFFTPRYVVEFLTDNTLGRIWYEMTKGKTTLVDSCQYLVRRPNEIFMEPDQQAPIVETDETKELSQAELLQQTVYIKHRPLKDPRDIKMLDPACGSMHFGLYAYDLFERIYSEAWDLEEADETCIFIREGNKEPGGDVMQTLHQVYESKDVFLADVPKLIIEHNIHGIDIDPRAAQIAGLSLWLRAQKSWTDNAIQPNQRPQVQRSNIVCAEPMPGETQLLKEFTSQIQPRVLGQLVEEIFDKMKLAGEAGSLLKIEEEIQSAIEEAKSQKDDNVLEVQGGLFGENKWEVREGKRYYNFGDIDHDFWEQAEQLILTQLELYAESASGSGYGQKRMFADDAAKGFAFIDLCRKRFDVVLMNPPFGAPSKPSSSLIKKEYPLSKNDIYGCFIESGILRRNSGGMLGAITSRTWLFLPRRKDIRLGVIDSTSRIHCMVDLGQGVLDNAMVETCAFCLTPKTESNPGTYFRLIDSDVSQKGIDLKAGLKNISCKNRYDVFQDSFSSLPGNPFAYWVSHDVFRLMKGKRSFCDDWDIGPGLTTRDNERFLRLPSEVPVGEVGKSWFWFAKGGAYSPYYFDTELVINYFDDGLEIKSWITSLGESVTTFIANQKHYFKPGFTYPRVAKGFNVRVLREGHVFAEKGIGIFPKDADEIDIGVLGYLNSSVIQELMLVMTPSRSWEKSFVANLPEVKDIDNEVTELTCNIVRILEGTSRFNPVSNIYIKPPIHGTISSSFIKVNEDQEKNCTLVRDAASRISRVISNVYDYLEHENEKFQCDPWESAFVVKNELDLCKIYFEHLMGVVFGRWDINAADADNANNSLSLDDLFSPLPSFPPGMIQLVSDRVSNIEGAKFSYPISIPEAGILEHDEREVTELISSISNAVDIIWGGLSDDVSEEMDRYLGKYNVHDYFSNKNLYFSDHIKRNTISRRQAPMYWPLQTPSGSYTLWIYYHRLNEQTLFACVNDFITPKLATLKDEISPLMRNSSRSTKEESELERLTNLQTELKDFQEEFLRLAQFWKPNLNDGVQVTAAPLWPLIQHTIWRNILKKTWEDLESGALDWSHMAFSIWPERVLKNCHADRSLAIAHGVAADLWFDVEGTADNGKALKVVSEPKPFSESELDAYIQQKIAQG